MLSRFRPTGSSARSLPYLAYSQFGLYRDRFSSVEGFFVDEAQAIWDFLLAAQTGLGVSGGFLEIGVWRGKSALMGAVHAAPSEPIVLVDINDTADVAEQIRAFHPENLVTVTGRSSSLFRTTPEYQQYRGSIRFFHVDGGHSCFGTYADIVTGSEMVGDRPLIAIDDFGNMRYPQLHAAVYKFLFARPDFRMVLCGANKAYLCRTEDFALYDGVIREHLVSHATALGHPFTLARTSYAHDFGCFAVQELVEGRPLVGRDEEPDTIVF
ncbi:MAG TPA: class I SAM-dependent methyltransferase [Gaiellaceae bacterium]